MKRKFLAWILLVSLFFGMIPSMAVHAAAEGAEVDVLLGVRQVKTITDKSGDHTDDMDDSDLNTSIATVALRGITTEETKYLSDKVTTLESGREYLIYNTRAQKPVTNNSASAAAEAGAGSGLSLEGSKEQLDDAAVWTLTAVDSGYTLQDADGKYMTIGSNTASLSDTAAVLTIAYNGSTWTLSQSGAYLNHFGGNSSTCAAGWQSTSAAADAGSQWDIYEVLTDPSVPATEITFTGVAVGETSVVVGDTTYNITVIEENVSVVTLDLNYSGAEESSKTVFTDEAIGELPVPMRPGYTFFGWYLDGTKIDSSYVVEEDITLVADWTTIPTKEKPENGTTTGQPFPVNDADGNAYCYRIPGIVTMNDGRVVAMSDHRWNTWADCGGLDTIVSVSTDNGETWTYTWANYLGDNGDTYNAWSTTIIDPAIGTDGETLYMIADICPSGISTMAHGYASQSGSGGFDEEGRLMLRDLIGDTYKVGAAQSSYIPMATSRSYDYYLNPEADGSYTIRKAADDSVVEGYTVDAFFNIRSADGSVDTHLFMADSPYQVYPTNYLYLNTSEDGLTWSAPKLLNLKNNSERAFLVGPGRGLVTESGRIVFTAYSYSNQYACLIFSTDGGETWTRSENLTTTFWSSETQVVELNDGTIRAFYRDGHTYLSYTDMIWDEEDQTYYRDPNATEVATAAAKNGSNGCMLSAIKYSQPIDGKEAILVATPATSSSRSDGHIYVFLVNEDGTMDLAYNYDITEGAEYYAYSCLTELNKGEEAGDLALFWEDSWNNSPAAATIRYSVIPMEQVIARENDVNLSYVDVELEVGGTATYTDETGDYTDADLTGLDTEVATVTMTGHTEVVNAVSTLGTSAVVNTEKCLFTFTASGDYYVISRELDDGTTLYLNHAGSGSNNIPLITSSNTVEIIAADDGMFYLVSQHSSKPRALHFHSQVETPYWNRCTFTSADSNSSIHATGRDMEYLFRPAAEGDDTTNSPIPGYVQITSVDEIVDGGQYLIAAKNSADNWYVLNPTTSSNSLEYVAQVLGQTSVSSTDITITGVGSGETEVQIGDVLYEIVVVGAGECNHDYVNGFCTLDDTHYEPATLNADGVYEIANGGQLYWFAEHVKEEADADAILVDNIVVNSGAMSADAADARVWNTIGYKNSASDYVAYNGTFDGNGKSISGLYYNQDETVADQYIGLFGVIGEAGVVQNVSLENTYFCGRYWVGGIAGLNQGTISGCSSAATVETYQQKNTGGIAGESSGTIDSCVNTGNVSGIQYVGGIVGKISGTVTNCTNSGTVGCTDNKGSFMGGIVGDATGVTTIENCYNTGNVTGQSDMGAVGGILGHVKSASASVTVSHCYNTGDITGDYGVGGIVGLVENGTVDIDDCYNTGKISAKDGKKATFAGGIAGRVMTAESTIDDCYNIGTVEADRQVGGIVGGEGAVITNCYYLVDCAVDSENTAQNGVGTLEAGETAADTEATVAATAKRFASGAITWLLNHESDEGDLVWFQTIDTHAAPKFQGKVVHHTGNTYYNDDAPVAGEVVRLAGSHRWNTALKVADEMKANLDVEKFDAIIIASGNGFADALAGSYLSTVKSAPILLSWGNGGKFEYLDTDNIDYIKANLAEGGTVYLLGGTSAVPELYETELSDYEVKRLGGKDRFETNLMILEEAGVADGSEILVCTSTNFADSLSASATGLPILLVWNERGVLYGEQPEYLAGLKDCTFTVIGGENAVSANLAAAIGEYGDVERLAGGNRFETSVLVAEKYFEAPETAVLAYAWNYPDGLCGGALAYTMNAPLVLTMTKYEAAAVEYAENAGISSGIVLGGDSLISDAAVRAIFAMDAAAEIVVK